MAMFQEIRNQVAAGDHVSAGEVKELLATFDQYVRGAEIRHERERRYLEAMRFVRQNLRKLAKQLQAGKSVGPGYVGSLADHLDGRVNRELR